MSSLSSNNNNNNTQESSHSSSENKKIINQLKEPRTPPNVLFTSLPDNVMRYIFELAGAPSMPQMMQSCNWLYSKAQDELLWRSYCLSKGCDELLHKTWKKTFKRSACCGDAYFEITIGEKPMGKIIFKLYHDVTPLTSENFRALCTGEMGIQNGVKMHYKGNVFHRVIPTFMCQAGDIEKGNGLGGRSIYGKHFADENFQKKHDKPFLLTMANAGPNTNMSQFIITFTACNWLDNLHVVFGEVYDGQDILAKMDKLGSQTGKTSEQIVISNCGAPKKGAKSFFPKKIAKK